MRLIRLTESAFEQAATHTRMGAQALEMAKAVLVFGRTQVDVAAQYGMSKQRVNSAVASIERVYKESITPGLSPVRVELELPETLALALGAFTDQIVQCQDAQKVALAVEKAIAGLRSSGRGLKTKS